MTLRIDIKHGSAGYPAIAHIAAGSYGAMEAKDGQPAVERWIHSGASAVVHELQPGETVEQAEDRALARMWARTATRLAARPSTAKTCRHGRSWATSAKPAGVPHCEPSDLGRHS